MATIAILAAGAMAAGASAYGASEGAKAQREGNANNRRAMEENSRINQQNALMDAINNYRNMQQQALDNRRYDEAKVAEDKQRQLVNALAMATQADADGNSVQYDPITKTWRTVNTGVGAVNADRRRLTTTLQGQSALDSAMVGGRQQRDRMLAGGLTQSRERALGDELLSRYAANQGRSPQGMEGALIEKNVAEATDPIRANGNAALLAGYRQGNSGNDALIGALARGGGAATRSAIANARLDAPGMALNERDAAAKSLLGPATTLNSRGTADPGLPSPVFGGDVSSNLAASLNRGNAAGVGTTLNPRNGQQASTAQRPGSNAGFVPLNANGNEAAGMAEALRSLIGSNRNQQAGGSLYNRYFGDSSQGLNYTGGAGANSAIYSDPSPLM